MNRMLLLVVMALTAGWGAWAADDFWTTKEIAEIDGFSELDGVTLLKFKDAVTAKPIADVKLTFDDGTVLLGGTDGIVKVPAELVQDTEDTDVPFTATAEGYIAYRDSLEFRLGSVRTKRFVLSPDLPLDQARFVLEWQKTPADLDAWLAGPGFTVSYRAMKNAEGNARLDRDAQHGFGPETLTLLHVKPTGDYLFSVVNYSNEAPMSDVKLSVYLNNALARVIFVPKTSEKKVDLVAIHDGQVQYLVR